MSKRSCLLVLGACLFGTVVSGCSLFQSAGDVLSLSPATLSGVTSFTAKSVAEAEVGVTAAEKLGAIYVNEPPCPTPAQGLNCSLAAVSLEIQRLGKQADTDLALAKEGTADVSTVVDDVNGLRALLPANLLATLTNPAPATPATN